MKDMLKELKGFEIKIEYTRNIDPLLFMRIFPEGLSALRMVASSHVDFGRYRRVFRAKGGFTFASIKDKNGNLCSFKVKCSDKDNFCYRVGRNIALGRAYKAYLKAQEDVPF
ncbi:MAG: hypothetical protein AABY22_30195 [Nanoarchaeota archaeon]